MVERVHHTPLFVFFLLPRLDLTQKEFQGQGCVVCLLTMQSLIFAEKLEKLKFTKFCANIFFSQILSESLIIIIVLYYPLLQVIIKKSNMPDASKTMKTKTNFEFLLKLSLLIIC